MYDISAQVYPAYGLRTIAADLELVSGRSGLTRWFGGELILGTPAFFGQLADRVDMIYPRYLDAISEVHHIGDEMVTSSALGLLIADGLRVQAGASHRRGRALLELEGESSTAVV